MPRAAARGRQTTLMCSESVSAGQQAPQTLRVTDFPSPEISRALSPNGRAHWTTKREARMDAASRVTVEATVSHLRPVHGPVRLTFRWIFPERRKRDLDNASTGVVKAALDALVRGRWIDADDSETVVGLTTEIRVERGRRALEIELRPMRGADGSE